MPSPFVGEVFTFGNPDGSEVTLRGWGNQFEAVFETLDGYTVVQAADGYFEYATPEGGGESLVAGGSRVGTVDPETLAIPKHLRVTRVASRIRAGQARSAMGPVPRWMQRRQEEQARRNAQQPPGLQQEAGPDGPGAAPPSGSTTGDYLGLVLLIDFSDFPQSISRQEVDDFCNKAGYSGFGNNGSAFDYFRDVSDGKLRYRNHVAAYYRAAHARTYYTDPAVAYGTRAQELIREALDSLVASGFDFSHLTVDSGNFIQALSVFYAGSRSNAWSQGLWPHSWALASTYSVGGGRRFSDYQITDLGSQLTLRTFCHENGHMVCDFPDLYDYDAVNVGNGIGHYSLMCFGGQDKNPTQVEAYLKHAAGWSSNVTTLAAGTTTTVEAGRNDFLIHARNAAEYFIIENRQQSGRDAALPDAGLAIWHVDVNGNNSNEQMTAAKHYECSLEQADNRFDLERRVNGGDVEDLYGGAAATFGPATTPASNWWDGTASGLDIEQVSAVGAAMTVKTRATGAQWYSALAVDSVFTTHHGQNGWASLSGLGWRKIQTGAPDGVTNMLAVFTVARSKNLRVTVNADTTTVFQTYL
ncbi:metalloprotease [Arthrobacter sp. ZBG10]|uniref:M6 family metalloprotease domain-containing protein n=1 Tax=Micrococcaceae TaxID=1268 RepID=UPI000680E9C4|nr:MULTISPECIES: M6 family metalloprotease domain-containing protein [Micrococcaceae]KNH17859.1 metalloprotease [Arthrobacter sp. ZBG10]KQR00062.1 metalloprotease [Arthrobacter sp. Leaf141]